MFRAIFIAVLLTSLPAQAVPDYSKDPVVMVHGYFLGEFGSWAWMTSRLEEAGWPPEYLYSFQFENVFGCNPDHGNELKAVVDKALAETGAERVDIVCHSMGCVDSRYYIKFLCGYERVKDFVSIAGAHKGSITGCLEPFSCGAEAMCVGPTDGAWMQNEFLMSLNWCDITPGKKIKYTSIWSPLDEIIIPQKNSIIEGAVNLKIESLAEHALILANEETATYVIDGLNGGGTNNNQPNAAPPCVTLCELPDDPWTEPDIVELGPEVVEPAPDIVEQEAFEVVTTDTQPETLSLDSGTLDLPSMDNSPQPKDGIGPTPAPGTDSLRRFAEEPPGDSAPRYSLPVTEGGCATTGAGSMTILPLLLLLFLVSLRSRRSRPS
jgi:triacylglycerol lipase